MDLLAHQWTVFFQYARIRYSLYIVKIGRQDHPIFYLSPFNIWAIFTFEATADTHNTARLLSAEHGVVAVFNGHCTDRCTIGTIYRRGAMYAPGAGWCSCTQCGDVGMFADTQSLEVRPESKVVLACGHGKQFAQPPDKNLIFAFASALVSDPLL